MKNKKILKTLLMSTSILSVTTTTALVNYKHKENPKLNQLLNDPNIEMKQGAIDRSWNAFKTSAVQETAKNIVAADTPILWKNLNGFLLLKAPIVYDNTHTIEAIILSPDSARTATFTTTYTKRKVYHSKNWKCVDQPKEQFVPSGLGKGKSVPYVNIEDLNNHNHPLTPSMVYEYFGVHQVIIMGANVYKFDGKKTLGWNAKTPLTLRTSKEATWIYRYEALGGRIGISFGGILGSKQNSTPWNTLDADSMYREFSNIAVKLYNMEDLDFDIEPGCDFNLGRMKTLVAGINEMTDHFPKLDVSLTLSSGPRTLGINFWGNVLDHSRTAIPAFKQLHKVPIINPMVFDFGTDYIPLRPTYLDLIKDTLSQTTTYFANVFSKIQKMKPQYFFSNHIEATTMIGRSDQGNNTEMLGKQASMNLAKYCKLHKLFRMSFWDINRDFPGKYSPVSGDNNGTENYEGTYSQMNVNYFEK